MVGMEGQWKSKQNVSLWSSFVLSIIERVQCNQQVTGCSKWNVTSYLGFRIDWWHPLSTWACPRTYWNYLGLGKVHMGHQYCYTWYILILIPASSLNLFVNSSPNPFLHLLLVLLPPPSSFFFFLSLWHNPQKSQYPNIPVSKFR